MLKIIIEDERVEISGEKNEATVENLMADLAIIARSFSEMDHLTEREKEIFMDYVKDLLPKIAFVTSAEVEQLANALERKNRELKEELNKKEKSLLDCLMTFWRKKHDCKYFQSEAV